MNVLIINHCSTNKGDKAVLESVLRDLVRNGVKGITVSANEPTCCNTKHVYDGISVKYVPWGWNVARNRDGSVHSRIKHRLRREVYKKSFVEVRRLLIRGKRAPYLPYCCNPAFWDALKNADLVLSTGGHHVTSLLAPDAVSPQTFDMALSLLAGKKLYLWSQTIGPLEFHDPLNREFIKKILQESRGIYIRDKASRAEIEKLGLGLENIHETYESVLGLCDGLRTVVVPSKRAPLVGISIYSTQERDAEGQKRYLTLLREFSEYVINLGFHVRFFPMQIKDEAADDRPCINSIVASIRNRDACSVAEDTHDIIDHINQVAGCRLFVGHKTHSVIFALITGTPLIAIAYHRKTVDFMEQFELSGNCVSDIHLDGKKLIEKFDNIATDFDALSAKQYSKSLQFGRTVREDFETMFEIIVSKRK